jgi:hypothetical protein
MTLTEARPGPQESLILYFSALQEEAAFPYRWRIAGADFTNLVSGHPVTARTVVHGSRNIQPAMWVPFMMLRQREVFVAPGLGFGIPGAGENVYLARLAPHVLFAGEMNFQFGEHQHIMSAWNGDSCGRVFTPAEAQACGLPMEKFLEL